MERFICIHGHFYQPPRENPWLEAVETQDSARPYHDWNARISAECYATNGAARILDGEGRIVDITNNFAHMSYNVGPTLLTWMGTQDPDTYASIIAADQQSRERFGGHGSAMAQVYNHLIMPLANQRDKHTQVHWGIADFVARFGRAPEGMWLAETAVDLATLEVLAAHGITFTVLAPHQAGQFRPLGSEQWIDVGGAQIDPTRPYRQYLPSGTSIDLFFYDGPIARAIAFENLLDSGETFAGRLASAFQDARDWPQIVHIATDGETYGHHHRHGEMALAYTLKYIEDQGIAKLINYGEYLEKFPPRHEVQIIEDTSWSCAHGVERWRSNCGCNGGGYPQWNQQWRAPLRDALDWLRDAIAPIFEENGRAFFADPWAARDAYIDVMLNRDHANVLAWLRAQTGRDLDDAETITALKLLEMQRNALLMYTSCGWFFDELSGIETVQVIDYAGRVVQLASTWLGDTLEAQFLERLERAQSNVPEHANGRRIYEKWVKPTAISLKKVTAHYAMSDLFENYPDETAIYCYEIARHDHRTFSAGKARLIVGSATVRSRITHETKVYSFTALHFDNHNLTGGVRERQSDDAYDELARELGDAFDRADLAETIRLLDKHFERRLYTLNQLFRDEQRKILDLILRDERDEAETLNAQIYDRNVALLRFLAGLDIPAPDSIRFAAEVALRSRLRRAITAGEINVDEIEGLVREADLSHVALDSTDLAFQMQQRIETLMGSLIVTPENALLLQQATLAARLAKSLPFNVDTWRAQNLVYQLAQQCLPEMRVRAETGDASATAWTERFADLSTAIDLHL